MSSAADMLKALLAGTQEHRPTQVAGQFAKTVANKAEAAEPQSAEDDGAQRSAAAALIAEITKGKPSASVIPLNGASVLRAALAGGTGTINGG